jgi:arsenite methyltransferase
MPSTATDPPAHAGTARRKLERRLARLRRVFDLEAIVQQQPGSAQVVSYFHQNFHPYRRYHSAAGSMHMALNPGGRFDADGFFGQARRIEALWQGRPPSDVLEVAFGKGINLAYLVPRWPAVRFSGIDLTPRNVKHAQTLPELAGVKLSCADLHALPQPAASFDCTYSIEAFCYATDVPRALAEQARVLRPGGLLVLIDGYRERALGAMSADEALAVRLVEKSMAAQAFQQVDELVAHAASAGLELVSNESLVDAVLPNFQRLDRLASAFLLVPALTRRWLAARSAQRGHNLVAAALGLLTAQLGLHGYRQLVLRRRAD